MESVYMICAVVGGTILVIQTILLIAGGTTDTDVDADGDVGSVDLHHDLPGHGDVSDHDATHDAHQAAFFKVLSFKTLVAFLTFFGLGGLAFDKAGFTPTPTLLLALGAGCVALYIVAYLMSGLFRLQSQGNVSLQNAVGQVGKVYLRIPGQGAGLGKVTVVIQSRSLECKARTSGPEIPTGSEVRIVGMAESDTLEVLPMEKE